MFDLSDLPESKLEEVLNSLGLLSGPTVEGNVLDPLTVQIAQFNPSAAPDGSRVCAIICSGQNNTTDSRYYQDYNATIVIASLPDRTDMITAKMISLEFDKVLREFNAPERVPGECGEVIGVVPAGSNGPFYQDDGRVVFDVSLRLLIS